MPEPVELKDLQSEEYDYPRVTHKRTIPATDEEQDQRKMRLVEIDTSIRDLEAWKKRMLENFNLKVKPLRSERLEVLEALEFGGSIEVVPVILKIVREDGIATAQLLDPETLEVVEERMPTDAELELWLDYEAGIEQPQMQL